MINNPQAVKSLIVASASPIVSDDWGEFTQDSGINDKYGAGLLNLRKAIDNNSPITIGITSGTMGQVVSTVSFSIVGRTPFDASVVNIVNNKTVEDYNPSFSIYNIRVIDPNGNVVNNDDMYDGQFSISSTTYNNVVKIHTLLSYTGIYKLEIFLSSIKVSGTEYLGISLITK